MNHRDSTKSLQTLRCSWMTADEVVSVDAAAALALSEMDGIMKQKKNEGLSLRKNFFFHFTPA